MSWSAIWKRLQKRSFDLLSHRYGALAILISLVIVTVAVIQFGETLVHWSTEKYAAVFNSFSDNLSGRSHRGRLCLPVPIDIVYTWVNGSDPILLDQLRAYRVSLMNEFKPLIDNSTNSKCDFESCIYADGVVVEPSIPSEISIQQFGILYPLFSGARLVRSLNDPITGHNVSMVLFNRVEDAKAAVSTKVVLNGQQASVRQLYYTTDKTLESAVPSDDVLIMTGFPDIRNKENLLESIPLNYRSHVENVLLHQDRGIAVLTISDRGTMDFLLTTKNITIAGKSPTFNVARLVWDLTDYRRYEDISASRFEDNEELRYSLRSIERHAPWVRHVFIVTNGQIPSWLNLDYDRVSIVTHADIFLNSSHLPTFSSPAIESHLHRIPGLSDYFIYMNDDVMFGRDVWPDDFISPSGTQKVYLTYPVPNCREGCPSSWISDGYCDRACNNSQCEWDGGDCTGSSRNSAPSSLYGGAGGLGNSGSARSLELYCSAGCANNWIADRYCDQSCNILPCAFDAGDCGTADFHRLHRIDVLSTKSLYDARGHSIFYFNLSTAFHGMNGFVAGGSVSRDDIVRSASIAKKFRISTVVLHSNQSARSLQFTFLLKNTTGFNLTLNIEVVVDTKNSYNKSQENSVEFTVESLVTISDIDEATDSELFEFQNSTSEKFPKPKYLALEDYNEGKIPKIETMLEYDMPLEFRDEYEQLSEQLRAGDLTQTGFQFMTSSLWRRFTYIFQNEGRKPSRLLNISSNQTFDRVEGNTSNVGVRQNTLRNPLKDYLVMIANEERSAKSVDKGKTKRQIVVRDDGIRVGRKIQLFNDETEEGRVNLVGFLPWEKKGTMTKLEKLLLQSRTSNQYSSNGNARRRHLLDTYADSLRHVSRVYNRAYGYTVRRVPAHMPHMINRRIMFDLQERFPAQWDETSSHRIRQADDMQYAFSYFYFLIAESVNMSVNDAFNQVDLDQSGVLSDKELRILATRIFQLPLDLKTLEAFEQKLVDCSNETADRPETSTVSREVYYEKRLPQVTRALITGCGPIVELLKKSLKARLKYQNEVVSDDVVYFKMLRANATQVVMVLDELRREMRKFVCLNDNIDYSHASAKSVKVILQDFYESFFPTASRFELPKRYRNRYSHVSELHEWWHLRKWFRRITQVLFIAAVAFAVLSFFSDRVSALRRRIFRRQLP